jgi:predicted nucleic acid-binding protein
VPEDWVAVGSQPIFDEYERKLPVVGARLGLALDEETVRRLRRQLEAVCPVAAPPFGEDDVPTLTRDPKDDPILYTALLADVDLLVSGDKDLVPDKHEQHWEHEGHTVLAMTFEALAAERLSDIDWDEIDGSWLAIAFE